MKTIQGLSGISAHVVADSISPQGIRLTTFELTYPRIIHSEFMTHRMISRNAASSRAIPFSKMKEQLHGEPVRFGAASPGMQDKGQEHERHVGAGNTARQWWAMARESAVMFAENLHNAGYHKQVVNRLTEPFQIIKVVATATEWENFFWLRDDSAADPTLAELARVMRIAKEQSEPVLLYPGEWHVPYVDMEVYEDETERLVKYSITHTEIRGGEVCIDISPLDAEQALCVSSARCAAVSFRNVDYTYDKSIEVFHRLVGDERKHASAFEHQGTPIQKEDDCRFNEQGDVMPRSINTLAPETWELGVSHMTRNGQLWSGNLKGFVQHRKLIAGENKES